MDKLDADDEDFITDEANRKDPQENIGKKNRKDPPEKIGNKNSITINPPETIANSELKSYNVYSDSSVNAFVSLQFLVDEVDDNKPKWQAFVAINYSPKIEGIGMYMHSLSFQFFVNVMHQLTIVFTFIEFIYFMNSFII